MKIYGVRIWHDCLWAIKVSKLTIFWHLSFFLISFQPTTFTVMAVICLLLNARLFLRQLNSPCNSLTFYFFSHSESKNSNNNIFPENFVSKIVLALILAWSWARRREETFVIIIIFLLFLNGKGRNGERKQERGIDRSIHLLLLTACRSYMYMCASSSGYWEWKKGFSPATIENVWST